MANAAYERRNRKAREEGYASYYDKRVKQAAERGLSKSQARGHATGNEMSARDVRLLNGPTKGGHLHKDFADYLTKNFDVNDRREILKRWEADNGIKLDHESWSAVLGSPKGRFRKF